MMTRYAGSRRLAIGVAAGALVALGVLSRTTAAFNPQPEPPGFGMVSLIPGQSIRINVVCFAHDVGKYPPGPCRGELMFHDADGNALSSQEYFLQPGQTASLEFEPQFRNPESVRAIVLPCGIPAPDSHGRAIPSAEVFSNETGQTMLFINPAVARLSDLDAAPGRNQPSLSGR